MRILFVSANPHWTQRLDLADELRTLLNCLQGHDVDVMLLPAAQPEDLKMAVKSRAIDIVHFSGHASDKDGLLFRNERGLEIPVAPEELRTVLQEEGVKLAVLNACNTKSTALGIEDVVGTVISTESKLDDGVAKLMTKALYSSLGRGETPDKALAEAEHAIRIDEGPGDGGEASRFVYSIKGSGKNEPLLPKTELFEGEPRIEGQPEYDRYFYISYLDDQIDALARSVRINRYALFGIFGVIIVCFAVWPALLDQVVSFFPRFLNSLASEAVDASGDTPLLDALLSFGEVVPIYLAALQSRWCVHGKEKLRQLKALRELVKNSQNLPLTLQTRLTKILDESTRAADTDWKPLWKLIVTLLLTPVRLLKSSPNEKPEAA